MSTGTVEGVRPTGERRFLAPITMLTMDINRERIAVIIGVFFTV